MNSSLIEWRVIPGYPGFLASSSGQILGKRGRPMHPSLSKRGDYPSVCLSIDGKGIVIGVHRLVCLAFHGLPPGDDYEVDHINRDKNDSRPENLRWLPWYENRFHPSLEEDLVRQIRVAHGSNRKVAKHYGVSHASVSRIRAGRWPHRPEQHNQQPR